MSKLRLKFIEINKNEILKNYGCAIKMFEVKGEKNDPSKVSIKLN